MKIITTLLLGGLALLTLNSPVLAQGNSENFVLNQPHMTLNLEQKDFETLYRTEQVPDTCYRQEVQGSVTQCHTEYDRRCHTETQRQCHEESFPVCTSVPRNVCHAAEECTNETDHVCNSHGCTNVPRRSCHTVNRCTTERDRVCHNEQRESCSNVPYQSCQQIPRQACEQVPNVVQVPYACTRTIQVPAGQQLKLHTAAKVDIQFANFNEMGASRDTLIATLANGAVTITKQQSSAPATTLYQIVDQQRAEQMISTTEKVISYRMVIKGVAINQLNSFLNSQLANTQLYADRLDFSLLGAMNVPFKGHLKLVKTRTARADLIILDSDFASRALVTQGNLSHLMFNNFNIRVLEYRNYSVELKLDLDRAALQAGLINPENLNAITNRSIQANFNSIPN